MSDSPELPDSHNKNKRETYDTVSLTREVVPNDRSKKIEKGEMVVYQRKKLSVKFLRGKKDVTFLTEHNSENIGIPRGTGSERNTVSCCGGQWYSGR
jgi:hypothetical protein